MLLLLAVFLIGVVSAEVVNIDRRNVNADCVDYRVTEPDSEKAVDFTFVLDGSISEDALKRQIDDLVSYMRQVKPFDEFVDDKINIRYVKTNLGVNLNCCNRGVDFGLCDTTDVRELASVCPTDEIIGFSTNGDSPNGRSCAEGEGWKSGVAIPGQYIVLYDYPKASDTSSIKRDKSWVMMHELGHVTGFLMDEYLYATQFGEGNAETVQKLYDLVSFYTPINCEPDPEFDENGVAHCSRWENVPGTGCYEGCTLKDWYRPTENNIMRDDHFTLPSPVDKLQFRSAMSRYVDYAKGPMSVEIYDPLVDFVFDKLIEQNPDWIATPVPDTEFSSTVWGSDVGATGQTILEGLMAEALTSSGLLSPEVTVAGCYDYTLDGELAELLIRFKDFEHYPKTFWKTNSEGNKEFDYEVLRARFYLDARMQGKASVNADGQIVGTGILDEKPVTNFVRDCKDLIEISWKADVPMMIQVDLKFENGPLGSIVVEPNVSDVQVTDKSHIKFLVDDHSIGLLGLLISDVDDVFDLNHYSMAYNFASEMDEGKRKYMDEFNKNMNDFALSLKASMDYFGVGDMFNTGIPHGMILDFYLEDKSSPNVKGVEVMSGDGLLRLSGMASMNTPAEGNRHECVKNFPIEFEAVTSGFDRRIDHSSGSFGAIQLSETFPNWFLATLWNQGFFCIDEVVPVDSLGLGGELDVFGEMESVEYVLIPTEYPKMQFPTSDVNNDGIVDLGDSRVEFVSGIVLDIGMSDGLGMSWSHRIGADMSIIADVSLEEPDATIPSGDGYSHAESHFVVHPEGVSVLFDNIVCPDDFSLCGLLFESSLFEDVLKREIIAPEISRALAKFPLNPVRDVNLNFGDVELEDENGDLLFDPPLNLDYGTYVAKVDSRVAGNKWMSYEFRLVPKCGGGDCRASSRAMIRNVYEFYVSRDSWGSDYCSLNVEFDEGSKYRIEFEECLNKLLLESVNGVYHFFKIEYDGSEQYYNYNFNLNSWTPFKLDRDYKEVFIAVDRDTYDKLLIFRDDANPNRFWHINDDDFDVEMFSPEQTQILAVRSKTDQGVEQSLECVSAVMFDRDANSNTYTPEVLFVTVDSLTKDNPKDNFVVCSEEEFPEYYAMRGYSL